MCVTRFMTIFMYCQYVGFDYAYIDINTRVEGINPFWRVKFGLELLLGLEPMVTISPKLLAASTFIKIMFSKPIIYVVTRNHNVQP